MENPTLTVLQRLHVAHAQSSADWSRKITAIEAAIKSVESGKNNAVQEAQIAIAMTA